MAGAFAPIELLPDMLPVPDVLLDPEPVVP